MRNRLMRTTFAKANQYPLGMMNTCPCGQVVLAPALYHEGEAHWENPNKCKDIYEGNN